MSDRNDALILEVVLLQRTSTDMERTSQVLHCAHQMPMRPAELSRPPVASPKEAEPLSSRLLRRCLSCRDGGLAQDIALVQWAHCAHFMQHDHMHHQHLRYLRIDTELQRRLIAEFNLLNYIFLLLSVCSHACCRSSAAISHS